jgi:hypothetical protein
VNVLAAVERVYDCATSCELQRHRIKHDRFTAFCLGLQQLQNALGDLTEDGYWRPILRYLCRFRYLASATPAAFSDPEMFSPHTSNSIEEFLSSRGRYLYPNLAAQALALLNLHREIAATATTNPLLDAITERLTEASALLVRETGLLARTQRVLLGFSSSVRVLAPLHLNGLACVDHLIIVGPARWYPEYVFTAPRAQRIELLQYTWMRDRRIEPTSFIDMPATIKRRSFLMYQDDGEEMIDSDAILPAVNWQQIVQTARTAVDPNQDEVDARIFVLDGGRAVFLEADEQATARIIDVNDEDQPVRRIGVTELTTGMFVLLRTSGGGDYIVPIADRILGANAETVRAQQRRWKQQLRELVRIEGVPVVARMLRDRGSRIASETNVRNWMAERSIKTAAYEDFVAIMEVIGEAARAKEYWNTMCVIDRAHRRAGFYISKLLLKQVKTGNLNELVQRGMLEFTLPDEEAGSIAAFRIEQVSPDIYRVPVTRIGHVFRT